MKVPLIVLGAGVAAAQVQMQGCYNSPGSLENQGMNIYQSTGACTTSCGKSVIATSGQDCWCGNEPPPASDKVADSNCDIPCPGYPYETCGGQGYWSVSTVDDDASQNATSVSSSKTATTSSIAVPTGYMNMNDTATSSTPSTSPSTSPPAEYTGAAASASVGAGAVLVGALFAFL